MLYFKLLRVAHQFPNARKHLVPLLRKYGQGEELRPGEIWWYVGDYKKLDAIFELIQSTAQYAKVPQAATRQKLIIRRFGRPDLKFSWEDFLGGKIDLRNLRNGWGHETWEIIFHWMTKIFSEILDPAKREELLDLVDQGIYLLETDDPERGEAKSIRRYHSYFTLFGNSTKILSLLRKQKIPFRTLISKSSTVVYLPSKRAADMAQGILSEIDPNYEERFFWIPVKELDFHRRKSPIQRFAKKGGEELTGRNIDPLLGEVTQKLEKLFLQVKESLRGTPFEKFKFKVGDLGHPLQSLSLNQIKFSYRWTHQVWNDFLFKLDRLVADHVELFKGPWGEKEFAQQEILDAIGQMVYLLEEDIEKIHFNNVFPATKKYYYFFVVFKEHQAKHLDILRKNKVDFQFYRGDKDMKIFIPKSELTKVRNLQDQNNLDSFIYGLNKAG